MTVDASNVSSVEIGTAHVVLTGDNNRVIQKVNLILKQRYLGDNTKLRRAIEHDLEMLEQYPEGAVRSELVAHIEENTNKLMARGRLTPQQVWARRAIKIGVSVVAVIVLVFAYSIVSYRESKVANGHPEAAWVGKWKWAIETLAQGQDLSPRGNIMPKPQEVLEAKGPDPETGKGYIYIYFTLKLMRWGYISQCAPGASDQTPHPVNGQFIAYDFELVGGDKDIHAGSPLKKSDFFAATLDGKLHDIGQGSGAECIPGASSEGIKDVPARSTQHITIVADVPPGNGYIGLNAHTAWPWEWAY